MQLTELTDFLANYLQTHRYPPAEQGGVFGQAGTGTLTRLGLALEPPGNVVDWIARHQLDALWLHRPWPLDRSPTTLPPHVGVLYHHLPFDETLTTGYNQPLARALGLTDLEELGHKQADGYPARAIGMIGNVVGADVPVSNVVDKNNVVGGDQTDLTNAGWQQRLRTEFGGYDHYVGDGQPGGGHRRVAVVGAMTDALVREAADRGVTLYLTGQLRKPAGPAVAETGMHIVALGHRRTEEWGLRALAHVLRAQGLRVFAWPGV